MCGAAAHDDRKTFRRAGRRFDGEGVRTRSFFVNRQAISSLTSRGNQPMFYPGQAIVVKIILIRAVPGSICPLEENKPFAVQ
jgi:hypothetical protein